LETAGRNENLDEAGSRRWGKSSRSDRVVAAGPEGKWETEGNELHCASRSVHRGYVCGIYMRIHTG